MVAYGIDYPTAACVNLVQFLLTYRIELHFSKIQAGWTFLKNLSQLDQGPKFKQCFVLHIYLVVTDYEFLEETSSFWLYPWSIQWSGTIPSSTRLQSTIFCDGRGEGSDENWDSRNKTTFCLITNISEKVLAHLALICCTFNIEIRLNVTTNNGSGHRYLILHNPFSELWSRLKFIAAG